MNALSGVTSDHPGTGGIVADFTLAYTDQRTDHDSGQSTHQSDQSGFQLKVNLRLPGQGISALFGQSGSGKTTLLRCIAGLERTSTGYLEVNGEVWQDSARQHFVATHQRSLGYVFQEASLFPHLSVQHNLDYAIRRSGRHNTGHNTGGYSTTGNHTSATSKADIIDMLGIGGLMQRAPARLSGGERQRVAIARALLTKPRLLLMDEPLSALDTARKQEILPYLERLHDELAIPMLYVSHQADEVARLADHLVLMENGQALASGALLTLLSRLDLPTALTEDAGAVIDTTVGYHDPDYHLMRLDFKGGSILVPHRDIPTGTKRRLRIHARDVGLTLDQVSQQSSLQNRIAATIIGTAAAAHPAHIMVQLDAGGTILLARITRRAYDQLTLAPGKAVWALIKSVALLA